MERNTDDDGVLDSEDTGLRRGDIFNDYPQHNPNAMDYYGYSQCKKKMYEDSSSDDDANGQHSNASNRKRKNDSKDDKHTFEHDIIKRQKLDGRDVIDDTIEQKNHWKENEDSTCVSESKNDKPLYMEKGQRMLEKFGYKEGVGLGKYGQGRTQPIELVTHLGRRGIGHYVPGLKEASLKWDREEEEIKAVESVTWLPNNHPCMLTAEEMTNWVQLGLMKKSIDDETTFCDPDIVMQISNSKTVFDKLDKVEMRKARTRSNPFETIRNANFLNRAAVKMANINSVCNLMFTNTEGFSNELLYFADVCAGPGGFSEYILSVKKWHAKGFGFTLQKENDFTLDEFLAGPCETFHPFYGSKENGDVFDPKNQEEFRALVMKYTYGKGVHFMMSDGGFSVEGQENIQEILSKQLYLCQCLVALMIVRTGGHFVTKLFDLFTPFSAGLVYLMYRCFKRVCILKPNSSRPANSERYLICRKKNPDTQAVMEYLSRVNHIFLNKEEDRDVIQLVPLEKLETDEDFLKYLRRSNETLGKKQIVGLLKIAAFCEDPKLIEPKQADMRKECLKNWKLSDKTRVRPHGSPLDKIKEILNNCTAFMGCDAQKLTVDNAKSTILDQPYDWYCIPCNSDRFKNEATFYLGLGRQRVYYYVKGKWNSIGDMKLELPSNTLVYAELVYESRWTGKDFTKSRVLHILDAYMLGGEDVSKKYILERHMLTKKFCDALWKPTPHDYVCVRAKEIFMLKSCIEKRLRTTQRRVKSMSTAFEFPKSVLERDDESDIEPLYFQLNSVLFLRTIVSPWHRYISQSTNMFYVFNNKTNEKKFENDRPPEAGANFVQTFENRVIWHWPQDNTLNMNTLIEMLRNPSQNA